MTFNELYERLETVRVKLPDPQKYAPFEWKPWKIVNPVERLPFIRGEFQALNAAGKLWQAMVDMDIPELEGAQWETRAINGLAELRLEIAVMCLRDEVKP